MSKLEKLAEEIGGKATYHYIENYVHKAVVSPANWIPEGAEAIKALFHEIVKEEDVKLPTEKADPSVGQKTPSQRLRAVLYRLWQQSSGGVDFESFYRMRLESIIDQVKDKLHD
jgi:hypothetical protein